MKPYLFTVAVILCLFTSWNLESLPLYYPHREPGFFADGAVEGICVENPEAGFYGLVSPVGASAVIWDPDCLTTRWSGSAGWAGKLRTCPWPMRFMAAASYFNCDFSGAQNLEDEGDVQLFAIDGGGMGGTIPATQNNFFHFSHKETQINALVSGVCNWCDGIILYPAAGYGFICQNQSFNSQLVNFDLGDFNNGTVHETLDTTYHGVNFELGAVKRCARCLVVTVIPFFGIYSARAEMNGVQDWGDNPMPALHLDTQVMWEIAYRGGLRGAILWECCRYHIGVQAFADYLSFTPGLYNPREDDEGPARITKKNSLRFGGGLVAGCHF